MPEFAADTLFTFGFTSGGFTFYGRNADGTVDVLFEVVGYDHAKKILDALNAGADFAETLTFYGGLTDLYVAARRRLALTTEYPYRE